METGRLLKITGSHVHCESGNISESNGNWYMVYRMTPFTMTLNDLEGYLPIASLFRWDFATVRLLAKWHLKIGEYPSRSFKIIVNWQADKILTDTERRVVCLGQLSFLYLWVDSRTWHAVATVEASQVAIYRVLVSSTLSQNSMYGKLWLMLLYVRDGTGSGFLTRDPTRPDPVVECCKTNPRQRLDSSIS